MSAPILQLSLSQRHVFLLNSRQGLFTATPKRSAGILPHAQGHSFSRSYGVILPSSLTRVLPVALVFSTRPPVSVCGTGTRSLTRGFSRQLGLSHFWPCGPPSPLRIRKRISLPPSSPYRLGPESNNRLAYPPASPLRSNNSTWYRNVDPLSIAYDFRPRLRPD